jgi:hypothetical protein
MSSNTLTFDDTTPRRPGIGDVGGGQKENDVEFPPDPDRMPTAEDFNQISKQIVALWAVSAVAVVHVSFLTGSPIISSVYSARTGLVAADFSLTDHGAGDTSVLHAGGKLPANTFPPFAMQVDDVEIDRIRAVQVTNGARVKTKLGATGTDANFVVIFSGI